MEIYQNNIYKIKHNDNTILALVLYNLSVKHFIGIPVSNVENECFSFKINSINKFVDPDCIIDINISKIDSCIYVAGKPLSIQNSERKKVNKAVKEALIKKIDSGTNHAIEEDLNFVKWCYQKLILNKTDFIPMNLKQNGIYWVNFGFNVGSELRKIRPALLWRSTKDKKIWTIIPISTKCLGDGYYFHYDVPEINSTIKIESMMNLSAKRVLEPYFAKGKKVFLTREQYEDIKEIIKKYYAFDN